PDALTRFELHGMHAARLLTEKVADAEIRLLSVDSRAPLSTEAAALAKAVLPDERTFLVRIECICHPGLLMNHDELATARGPRQDWRGGKVEVWSLFRRTLGIVWVFRFASHHPHVFRRLIDPLDLPGCHVQRDDCICRSLRRIGIAVPGCDVDRSSTIVDGRSPPDAASGRTPCLHAVLSFRPRLRLFSNAVGLPHHGAVCRVEGCDAATKRAAFIAGPSALSLLPDAGHRDVQAAFVQRGRPGHRGTRVIVDLAGPELLSSRGIDCIRVGAAVAEVRRVPRSS